MDLLKEDLLELQLKTSKQDSTCSFDSISRKMNNQVTSSDQNLHIGGKRIIDPKRIKVRTRISRFADYTSTHGVAHIKRVEHPLHKIIWTCCLLVAVSYFGYQVVSLVRVYMDKDYTVLIDIKFDRQLKFPAVTICNLNPIRIRKLRQQAIKNPELMKILQVLGLQSWESGRTEAEQSDSSTHTPLTNTVSDTMDGTFTTVNGTSSDTVDNSNTFTDDEAFWDFMNTGQQDSSHFNSMSLMEQLLDLLSPEVLADIGHKLQTMLLDCDFQGNSCQPRNFSRIYNPDFGNCYTFNLTGDDSTISRPGPKYGLTLDLYLEVNQYIYEIVEGAGAIVSIHDQNEMPMPQQSGFLIAPGFETKIGITRHEIKRLGAPYYTCWDKDKSGIHNIYNHRSPNSYTYSICLLSCYQNALIKLCECGDAAYPLDSPVFGKPKSPCLSINQTQVKCKAIISTQYETGTLECDCKQPCTEVTYKGSVSSVVWPVPNAQAQQSLIDKYIDSRHPSILSLLRAIDNNNRLDTVRNNVAKVHVYFEELNYEQVFQKEAYTVVNLISDLGGNMGMFVGMSLLTLVEYGELLTYICYGWIRKCLNKSKGK